MIALVFAAGGMLVLGLRSHQPSYHGKNLREWLARLELNGDTDRQAMEAVQHIGTNALPMLVKMMRSEDSAVKRKLLLVLRQQHLVKIRIMDDTEQHLLGMVGFSALGSIGQPALPALEPLVWKSNTTRFATYALAALGDEGLRAATAGLRSTNVTVRRETAGALGGLGVIRFLTNSTPHQLDRLRSQAEIAIPALIATCDDPDEIVRARAAIALGLLGHKPDVVVPVLVKLLRDQNGWRVPSAAAKSLGRFGTNAASAIPALKEALNNTDRRVSQAADGALAAVQGKP